MQQELTREKMEDMLRDAGFKQGVAHEDPEKDATHVWVDEQGNRFVRFVPKGEKDPGELVYGSAKEEEAGIGLPYRKAAAVLTGLITAQQAHSALELPTGIFDPQLGHALGTSSPFQLDPATATASSPEDAKQLKAKDDGGEQDTPTDPTDTIPADKPEPDAG